ncbi:OmpA family protein [Kordiimonas sp. SCSIO 12610]|uniref:OmpA family protein n=1 Tax=Kordiimonas sp. SCSIO 12610 TaxID=2829597 RepID=UPI00210C4D50|nr:OmpA family protein [Kordiimonas sp. SCSIO 12610]UTW56638.1 OmpA family protein [Kordiimonas sp. SCSIO 12610]
MRKALLSALLLTTANITVVADDHDDDGFYAGLQLGVTLADDARVNATGDLFANADADPGLLSGLFLGRKVGKWRYEFEYAARRNSYDQVNFVDGGPFNIVGLRDSGGHQESDAFMANVHYQFGEIADWKAFIGAGIGFARMDVSNLNTTLGTIVNDSDTQFAGQGMVHAARKLTDNVELGLGYRYFRTALGDFQTPDGIADFRFQNHELFARVTWLFGGGSNGIEPATVPEPVPEPAPKPAPAAAPEPKPEPKPAPKPEPKPAPLPGPFIVFFDFDSSSITDSAQSIIDAAADAFEKFKVVRIRATGHTDRAGSDNYNSRLSRKRAENVRSALIAKGVPAQAILVSSKGETSPLVSTADNVREAQNRRVEIVLSR